MWALPARSAIKGRSSSSPERGALGASPLVPRFGPDASPPLVRMFWLVPRLSGVPARADIHERRTDVAD
jgi:hypothetical protein